MNLSKVPQDELVKIQIQSLDQTVQNIDMPSRIEMFFLSSLETGTKESGIYASIGVLNYGRNKSGVFYLIGRIYHT